MGHGFHRGRRRARARGGPLSSSSPADLSSLYDWARGADFTVTSGRVETWTGVEGNAAPTQGVAGDRPVHVAAELNGKDVARFASATREWLVDSFTEIPKPYSIWLVVKSTWSSGNEFVAEGNTNGKPACYVDSGGGWAGHSGGSALNGGAVSGGWQTILWIYDTTSELWEDFSQTDTASTGANGMDGLRLGARTTGNGANCDIAAWAVQSAAATAADRQTMQDWVGTEFGL